MNLYIMIIFHIEELFRNRISIRKDIQKKIMNLIKNKLIKNFKNKRKKYHHKLNFMNFI